MTNRADGDNTVKRRAKVFNIKGCKSSLVNKQLLVSTGIPSLDFYLGGGIPVGSILLIEEDEASSYSSLFFKYFLAEGVVSNHSILLASLDQQPSNIINDLPKACSNDRAAENGKRMSQEEGMKIAWRYEEMTSQSSDSVSDKYGHHFDLVKNMDTSLLNQCNITLAGENELLNNSKCCTPQHELLRVVKDTIDKGEFSTSGSKTPDNILRIGINSFASPLWSSSSSQPSSSFCQSLLTLKHLMRSSFSVCLISTPTHVFEDDGMALALENMCDAVVRLESFEGTPLQDDPIFKNYNGLLHVLKTPRLNSIVSSYHNDLSNLAFKLHRKQFSIEKFCLPPLFSEEKTSGEETKQNQAPSRTNKPFDF